MRRLLLLIAGVLPLCLMANGLKIDGLVSSAEGRLTFEVSWENSWNLTGADAPGNADAVWIFLKGRSAAGIWSHVPVGSALTPSSDLTVQVTSDGRGLLVQPAFEGVRAFVSGTVEVETDGDAFTAYRVSGIEMVLVPEGGYDLGDSVSVNTLLTSGSGDPYRVGSESTIPVGTAAGRLWSADDFPPAGDLPAAWPKGYAGFYAMKYEISQDQYAAFLQMLTPAQAAVNRPSTAAVSPCFAGDHIDGERHYIRFINGRFGCDANGNGILNESDDGGTVACNFLTWRQFSAYLDWAALRPMTELEFEKACRGPLEASAGEFAWGTGEVINTSNLAGWASESEHSSDTLPDGSGRANYGYCLPSGPLRTGFAAFGVSDDRIASGASYYGLMEMSGNVWEMCVPMTASGLAFRGEHGDGELTPEGRENAWNWATGAGGFRGGAWNSGILPGFRDLAVSDRFFVYLDPDAFARGTSGGRGVISINRFE